MNATTTSTTNRCGQRDHATRFGCGCKFSEVDSSGADRGPVTLSGLYSHPAGGVAYFFWDSGFLKNNPPQCAACVRRQRELWAIRDGFKSLSEAESFENAEMAAYERIRVEQAAEQAAELDAAESQAAAFRRRGGA